MAGTENDFEGHTLAEIYQIAVMQHAPHMHPFSAGQGIKSVDGALPPLNVEILNPSDRVGMASKSGVGSLVEEGVSPDVIGVLVGIDDQ